MSDSNCEIPLEFNSIRWLIRPSAFEDEGGVIVRMEWGWSAGVSEEEVARLGDDVPPGKETVVTTLRDAEWLRDALTEIIEANRSRNEDLESAWREKMRKFDDVIKRAFPLPDDE